MLKLKDTLPQPLFDKPAISKTEEQQAVLDHIGAWVDTNAKSKSLVINATAGSGKSTLLKWIAEELDSKDQPFLYLVFGSKNQKEAQEKFPESSLVQTLHVYGKDCMAWVKSTNLGLEILWPVLQTY